jgi:hypothetical protein
MVSHGVSLLIMSGFRGAVQLPRVAYEVLCAIVIGVSCQTRQSAICQKVTSHVHSSASADDMNAEPLPS